MKKLASLAISILCVIACASIALSATQGPVQMFAGQVIAIDSEHKTFTLKEDNKGLFTCTFTDSTPVMKNNQQGTIAELKVGDIAAVIYGEASGKKFAKTVTVFVPVKVSH